MNNIYNRVILSPNFFIVIGVVIALIGVLGILNPGGSNALSAFNTLSGGYLIGFGVAFKIFRYRDF